MQWQVVVTAYDSESGRPGSNPEWELIIDPSFKGSMELIYYKASITAQGLPEPSFLRGSTLGTRAAEHKSCYWGMQIFFFQHNFCVKPYVPREPQRDPSNRRLNEHGIYTYIYIYTPTVDKRDPPWQVVSCSKFHEPEL